MTRWLLLTDSESFNWMEAFVISFLLTLFVTGVFAFIGFAYPTHQVFPASYYQIKNPKLLKISCRILGVKYFRAALLFFFWGRGGNPKKFFNGTKEGLDDFIYQTKQSEFGHTGAFIVILLLSVVLLSHGYVFSFWVMSAINVIGNLYPVLLQRSHRLRVERMRRSIR